MCVVFYFQFAASLSDTVTAPSLTYGLFLEYHRIGFYAPNSESAAYRLILSGPTNAF